MAEKSKFILLVEDAPNVRDFLETTLKFKGYRVVSTQDGREALEQISIQKPSLVVTDILMPRLDGFALAYKLRTNPATCNIPVMILSATYITPEDRDFAYKLGIACFMEKPIDVENFLLTIAEILTGEHFSTQPLLSEDEFLAGYRARLENKLSYKITQIARIERLLPALPNVQRPAFESLREQAVRDRDSIHEEIEEIARH